MNTLLHHLFRSDFSHNDYDRYYFGLRYLGNRFLLSKLKELNLKGERILDVGSGRLILSSVLASSGSTVVAIDLPEVFENRDVRKRASAHSIRLVSYKLPPGRSLQLPFKDKCFSIILMTEVFEHLNFSPIFLLNEIRRVLKVGGLFILTTPNVHRIENKLKFLFNKNIYGSYERYLNEPAHNYHWREFDKKELLGILNANNFRIKKTYFCNDILINKFSKHFYRNACQRAKAHLKKWIYPFLLILSGFKKQIILFAIKQ